MKTLPKFSIVTPSYNQAAFIAETIESVLSQKGRFEIEYFVMDGGSTDGSVEIIKEYADRVACGDWPVKCAGVSMFWVSQKDKGQSDAINQGLRRSSGDILSYINSDDRYCPGAFERVADEFANRPDTDFIYGDGDVIDEHSNLQWEWLSRPYNHSILTSYRFLWNECGNYILQQATFWRKRVLDSIGYFDETFHYAMDLEYWVRAGHNNLKLQHIPCKFGMFRLIAGTKSLSSPTVFWEDQLEIYRRYRGSHAMAIYFAYYYYNVALHFYFDPERAREDGHRVFIRWQKLSTQERYILARKSEYGFAVSCLLLARDLQRQHRIEEASALFKKGIRLKRSLLLHPFSIAYWLRCLVGSRGAEHLDQWTDCLINLYRRVRFDYRYYQTSKTQQNI